MTLYIRYVTPVTVFMISFHRQNPKSLPVSYGVDQNGNKIVVMMIPASASN